MPLVPLLPPASIVVAVLALVLAPMAEASPATPRGASQDAGRAARDQSEHRSSHAKSSAARRRHGRHSKTPHQGDVEVVDVDLVAAPDDTGASGQGLDADAGQQHATVWSRLTRGLGHLHAAAVHLPIAWILLWLVIEGLVCYGRRVHLEGMSRGLGWATTLSFVPAAISGLLRYGELAAAAADTHAMDPARLHRNLIWGACALSLATCLCIQGARRTGSRACAHVAFACLALAAATVGISAHLGGRLVYGDDFLSFPW